MKQALKVLGTNSFKSISISVQCIFGMGDDTNRAARILEAFSWYQICILVPRAAILLASASDRELWQVAIHGLPIVLRSLNFFSKWRTKPNLLHEALNHGMEILDLSDITLKGKKFEGLKLSVLVISPLNSSNTRSNF